MAKSKKPRNGRRLIAIEELKKLWHLGAEQDAILRGFRDRYGSQIPEITGIIQALYLSREAQYDRLRRLIVEYHRSMAP